MNRRNATFNPTALSKPSLKSQRKYGRRAVIKNMGLTGAAASLLPVLQADAEGNSPRRIVFFTTPNGIEPEITHIGTEANYTLGTVLSDLQAHKSDITCLFGVDMLSYTSNPIPNDHPSVGNQILTAAYSEETIDSGNNGNSNNWQSTGQSIDQFIADHLMADVNSQTKFHSIVCGADVAPFSWKQVFTGPKAPIFPELDGTALHSRLFSGISGNATGMATEDAKLLLAREQSVIDAVRNDLNRTLAKVSQADRVKIESHLTSIREIERRLKFDAGGFSCAAPILRDHSTHHDQEENYRKASENMMDNIAHAFACDLTRVATLQMGNGSSAHLFPSLELEGPDRGHHAMTHNNYEHNRLNRHKISQWYAARFKYFVEKLKSIPEGDNGTVFDNTVIIWTSEHSGFEQHGRTKLPFTLAGDFGGTLKRGRFLDYSGQERGHGDLYVTLAQAAGIDVDYFGEEHLAKGTLPGLLA